MTTLRDQVIALLKKAQAEKPIPEPVKTLEKGHPLTDKTHLSVFLYVLHGHVTGGKSRPLDGATDGELQIALNMQHNTLRYTRWSMVKAGYLADAGMKRSLLKGKPGMKVWKATDKWTPSPEHWSELDKVVTWPTPAGASPPLSAQETPKMLVLDAEYTVVSE